VDDADVEVSEEVKASMKEMREKKKKKKEIAEARALRRDAEQRIDVTNATANARICMKGLSAKN